MPITVVAPRALTVKDQKELVRIVIDITCDGTTNTVAAVTRMHQIVTRDNANAEIRRDISLIAQPYVLTDFIAAVQTGLTNFANALDVHA